MKQHRFFVEGHLENADEVLLTDRDVIHQMLNVLRLSNGDPVILLDGSGIEFHGVIKEQVKKNLIISKEKIKKISKTNEVNVHLFAALVKKDKFEWVLQKATELGVTRVTPIITDRTEKMSIPMDRADKIVREAAEQSGRADIPFLDEPISLKEALRFCETTPIVLHLHAERINVTQLRETQNVAVFVGPEGGFSDRDLNQFRNAKAQVVSLGEQVLRAETASVAVCSLLLLG